jgi:hypothetical protein
MIIESQVIRQVRAELGMNAMHLCQSKLGLSAAALSHGE